MTSISKAWDWSRDTRELWHTPSEESHYLVERWKGKGFTYFLDLGCGLGRHSLLFARHGFTVDSFDLSREAIEGLATKASSFALTNLTARTGDMMKLPYADSSMDCLLAYHVISHTDSKGIHTIVSEINRVLKEGGEFFLTLCSKKSWSFTEAGYPKLDEHTIVKIEDGPENGIPHFYCDETTITQLFTHANLISIRHIQDCMQNGTALNNSWHYFILGGK